MTSQNGRIVDGRSIEAANNTAFAAEFSHLTNPLIIWADENICEVQAQNTSSLLRVDIAGKLDKAFGSLDAPDDWTGSYT